MERRKASGEFINNIDTPKKDAFIDKAVNSDGYWYEYKGIF